ncbi:class I SAM-dependent methyltransferase [Flavobacteriaceae bacterium F89]|uniref:Class I SAM-dependent methyltransferase n=2 Tax=Cerina litoralis TaxID=2874477 RepID=A0AAE3JRE8_9FLAO|nr:class I SAM-dependent methyltransferase [Cerina litoralis]
MKAISKGPSQYWDNIYTTKQSNEVSWTQEVPKTSLDFIHSLKLPKSSKIIDVGGGESRLVDNLLEAGFKNITVLDISAKALEKARNRLGDKGKEVNWIVEDVTKFVPDTEFDVWHDRATFHFLTTTEQIAKYLAIAKKSIKGYLILGTFSEEGPKKCSGLDIKQYSEDSLTAILANGFKKLHCKTEDHITPFNSTQNFLFCSFKRYLD